MATRINAHAHNAFHLRLRVRASATASPQPHSAMLTPLARVRHTSHRNSGNAWRVARACSAPQRMAGRAKMHASFGHHRSALATRCSVRPCPKMKATVTCCVIVCAAIGAHPFAYARVQAALDCESGQPQRQTRAKRWCSQPTMHAHIALHMHIHRRIHAHTATARHKHAQRHHPDDMDSAGGCCGAPRAGGETLLTYGSGALP